MYLVIDRTKTMPIRLVAERGGKHFGNTQMLHPNEVKDYGTMYLTNAYRNDTIKP